MNFSSLEPTPALMIFLITIVASAIGLLVYPKLIERSLFRPYWFLRNKQYDTIVTSGFVHANFAHLLFNMFTFYFFAFALERRIGGVLFLILYLLGLSLSELGTFRKHRNNPDYATLGASGAISAVLFASIIYDPSSRLLIFPLPIPIPAWLFAVLYLGYTYYSARNSQDRINHDAHLGGALTGLAFVGVTDPGAYGRLFASF